MQGKHSIIRGKAVSCSLSNIALCIFDRYQFQCPWETSVCLNPISAPCIYGPVSFSIRRKSLLKIQCSPSRVIHYTHCSISGKKPACYDPISERPLHLFNLLEVQPVDPYMFWSALRNIDGPISVKRPYRKATRYSNSSVIRIREKTIRQTLWQWPRFGEAFLLILPSP